VKCVWSLLEQSSVSVWTLYLKFQTLSLPLKDWRVVFTQFIYKHSCHPSQPGSCGKWWAESDEQWCPIPMWITWVTVVYLHLCCLSSIFMVLSELMLLVICPSLTMFYTFSHIFYYIHGMLEGIPVKVAGVWLALSGLPSYKCYM
jgi:hypothetical protein